MKKKASTYADMVEKNKDQLRKQGFSYEDIDGFKKKKNMGKVHTSKKPTRP